MKIQKEKGYCVVVVNGVNSNTLRLFYGKNRGIFLKYK